MKQAIQHICGNTVEVFLPMPVFPVIEDVGWWQGADGSAAQQPFRNGFPRRHCLADYRALVRLAGRLGVRIGLGMVLGEWDRSNVLRTIPGATWLGDSWDNRENQGSWLEATAEYLRGHRDLLELGLHGLCHEFWNDGKMERSEFHDRHGTMRSPEVIRAHLTAFATILEQNGFSEFPRLFFPPALHHSFGNGGESIQAILASYGIRHVITRLARARRFAPPLDEKITWECGVGLLERGISPVPWNAPASSPGWDFSGPILPLHWGNLLHPDPERSIEVIDGWADLLLAGTAGPERILVKNYDSCWRQAAIFYFARLSAVGASFVVDLRAQPEDLPNRHDAFFLTMRGRHVKPLVVRGALVLSDRREGDNLRTLELLPENESGEIELLWP